MYKHDLDVYRYSHMYLLIIFESDLSIKFGDPAEIRFGDSGFWNSGRTRANMLGAISDDIIQEPTPMNKAVNVMVVCEL